MAKQVKPATIDDYLKLEEVLPAIKEQTEIPSGTAMVKELLADHETVSRTAKAALQTAEQAGDDASGDMMVQRMQVHDKTAWMLRSMVA